MARGSIPSFLNNGRHVSRLLDFVIILIILFWILDHVHNSPPHVPFLSHIKLVHFLVATSLISVLIFSSHLYPCIPRGLFASGFPTKTLDACLRSLICATCLTHLIHDLITQIIFGEEYRFSQFVEKLVVHYQNHNSTPLDPI